MKFFIDANLPFAICLWFYSHNYDSLHTDHLPNKEKTSDTEIRNFCNLENRILITRY